jgi:hypothetical protein
MRARGVSNVYRQANSAFSRDNCDVAFVLSLGGEPKHDSLANRMTVSNPVMPVGDALRANCGSVLLEFEASTDQSRHSQRPPIDPEPTVETLVKICGKFLLVRDAVQVWQEEPVIDLAVWNGTAGRYRRIRRKDDVLLGKRLSIVQDVDGSTSEVPPERSKIVTEMLGGDGGFCQIDGAFSDCHLQRMFFIVFRKKWLLDRREIERLSSAHDHGVSASDDLKIVGGLPTDQRGAAKDGHEAYNEFHHA